MIVHAKTSKKLSLSGRLGVLGLTTLILPLAPTWGQKSDPAKPDSGSELAAKNPTKVDALYTALVAMQDAEKKDDDAAERNLKQEESAEKLAEHLKELGARIVKDAGPVGEEIRKALEKAASEVNESLKKEGLSGEDLGRALDRAREELQRAFETGGPVEREAREAVENAREDVRRSIEKAREDLHEAVRSHEDDLKRALEGQPPAERSADRQSQADDVESARREVREIEAQLRRAMRRLEAIERREGRASRNLRRGLGAPLPRSVARPVPPAPPEAPEARPATPGRPAPPRPPAPPEAPVARPAPETRPAPAPEAESPSVTPPRRLRAPGPPGGRMGPGMMGPGGPVANPRVERRLRDLEEKMDRLLNELQNLKGEKKDSEKSD
jgi:hypothetical protein